MPRKVDPRFVADDDPMLQDFDPRRDDLQRQHDEGPSSSDHDRAVGMFPIILAMLVVGRMLLYLYVERSGNIVPAVGIFSSVVFGGAAIAVIWTWMKVGWQIIEWLMIPKLVVVFVSLLAAAQIFSGGMIWEGVVQAPAGHPFWAMCVVLAALLLAASTVLERGIMALLDVLNHSVSKQ